MVVLEHCIENGLQLGYRRAYKHDDNPGEQAIIDKQFQAILNEIHEWFDMEDKYEE